MSTSTEAKKTFFTLRELAERFNTSRHCAKVVADRLGLSRTAGERLLYVRVEDMSTFETGLRGAGFEGRPRSRNGGD
jgi:hypothetical protein